MLVVHNLEHQTEETNRYLSAVLEVKDHVEGLDVGEVLEQVEVPLEGWVLGILQACQLLDEEHEDGLDLTGLFVRSFRGKNTENVSNAASSQKLNIPT